MSYSNGKNINMVYIHFYEKSFTKLSFLEQCSMEFKGESSGHPIVGGVLKMVSVKTSPKLHFGLTKKDPGLVLHFDVLDLFKSWSKLSLTRIQMSKTNSKK